MLIQLSLDSDRHQCSDLISGDSRHAIKTQIKLQNENVGVICHNTGMKKAVDGNGQVQAQWNLVYLYMILQLRLER